MSPTLTPFPGAASDDAIEAAMRDFPYGRGWTPMTMYRAESPSAPYRGLLRRGTPNGPDEVYCGDHADELAAWRAINDTGRRMLEAWQSGDTALMALMRASIKYATV